MCALGRAESVISGTNCVVSRVLSCSVHVVVSIPVYFRDRLFISVNRDAHAHCDAQERVVRALLRKCECVVFLSVSSSFLAQLEVVWSCASARQSNPYFMFIDVLQLSSGAFRSAAIVAGPKRRGSIQSVVDEFPTWTRGVVSGSHPRRGSWGFVTGVVFRRICMLGS